MGTMPPTTTTAAAETAAARARLRQPVSQLQGQGVAAERFRVGAGQYCVPSRRDRRGGGEVRAACQMPVLGQVALHRAGSHRVGPSRERRGEAAMQAPPFARQQMSVKHLPDQLVPEGVTVAGRDQQSRVDGLLRRGQQLLFRKLSGRGHQVMRHLAVGDADLPDHRSCQSCEPSRPGQHGVADRGGQDGRARDRHFPGVQRITRRDGDHRGSRMWKDYGRHRPGVAADCHRRWLLRKVWRWPARASESVAAPWM